MQERAEWLKQMRAQSEALYDQIAPAFWVKYGLYPNAAHRQYLACFLGRLELSSHILDAACGAGRYDGLLLEAGHRVLGIDQSAQMLERGRQVFPAERFPGLRYERMGLQEMDFEAQFDGAICMDAMEHVCPEDWPGILARFHRALKPGGSRQHPLGGSRQHPLGGLLYFTVEVEEADEITAACQQARALGLPLLPGEMVFKMNPLTGQVGPLDEQALSAEGALVYHYYPSLEQVRAWLAAAGLAIEEEGSGDGYAHFLARKSY